MGESNTAHFVWFQGAIKDHATLFKHLQDRPVTIYGVGEQGVTPPLAALMTLLSPATIQWFDLYPARADVSRLDVNDLDGLDLRSCAVVTLLRTSVFIRNPQRVLTGFHRILRPGGMAIVDWLHGSSDAPVLDLGPPRTAYLSLA
jgi:hypothetical protein